MWSPVLREVYEGFDKRIAGQVRHETFYCGSFIEEAGVVPDIPGLITTADGVEIFINAPISSQALQTRIAAN